MLIQSVLRPVLQPVLRSIFDPGIGGGAPIWTPASLFAKYSGVGGYWDWTDIASLSQDSAGTTPVTAASQPVGRVLDQSGQGNHLIQSVAGKRPQYNGAGITPDGVDDSMVTAANLDLTACDKVVVAMGYEKLDNTARPQMINAPSHGGTGMFYVSSGLVAGASHQAALVSGNAPNYTYAGFAAARPNEYGAHIVRDSIPGNITEVWWNETKGVSATAAKGGGTYRSGGVELFKYLQGFSNTPARRSLVLAVPVANSQVSDDDIELIRLWLMEGA